MTAKKPSLTARKIMTMLSENTGRDMLDSGGAYGRNWERNQGRSWLDEPSATVEFDERDGRIEASVTLNVFHFLLDRVTYSPSMQGRFTRFCNRPENRNDDPLGLMKKFAKKVGDGKSFTCNTYNGEDSLSQVIQYIAFEIDGTAYALLQIHGGCDVRGGYTGAVAFKLGEDESNIYSLTDNASVTLCAKDGGLWDSDDGGYHWKGQEFYVGPGLLGDYQKSPDFEKTPATRDGEKLGDGVHFVLIGKKAYAPNGAPIKALG